jgi:hypothetical protein
MRLSIIRCEGLERALKDDCYSTRFCDAEFRVHTSTRHHLFCLEQGKDLALAAFGGKEMLVH